MAASAPSSLSDSLSYYLFSLAAEAGDDHSERIRRVRETEGDDFEAFRARLQHLFGADYVRDLTPENPLLARIVQLEAVPEPMEGRHVFAVSEGRIVQQTTFGDWFESLTELAR